MLPVPLPGAAAENQLVSLQRNTQTGNISTMTSHFTTVALHEIIDNYDGGWRQYGGIHT